jgi:hypothetical protein
MYISMKYIVLYVGAGVATGWLSKGDRTASLVGICIAGLIGFSFGISYAVLSAVEFIVGLGIARMLNKDKGDPS